MKELKKDDFNLLLVEDLGMIYGKRSAILKCPYCTSNFTIKVTTKSKKQQCCIKCRGLLQSIKAAEIRQNKRESIREKTCTKCKKLLNAESFSKREASMDGLAVVCRSCAKTAKSLYLQTEVGCLTQLYNTQTHNSKKRGHCVPLYTREELIKKYINTKRFNLYFSRWREEGFQAYSDTMPSFDRIDDSKPYSLDNIRLTTYRKNLIKEHLKYRGGKSINSYISPVSQLRVTDNYVIASFHSISEAERATGIKSANISKVCRGIRNTAGSYSWKYNTQA